MSGSKREERQDGWGPRREGEVMAIDMVIS